MIYKFDNIEVDTLNFRLLANGQLVSIEPQVFDLLVYLLTNRDRLVTRQEILDAIWQDREVSDTALSNLIKSARKAIGDDGNQQRIIKTVHGRGYQFIFEVNKIDDSNKTSLIQTYSPKVKLLATIAVIIFIVPFLLNIYFGETNLDDEKNSYPQDSENMQKSIAVLAFDDLSPNKDQEYFSDGISEEILNVLAKIPNLHVISKSSAFAFKGVAINIPEVAAKLGVKHILEGSVRKAGNRIRITAQLIAADSDKHLWSQTYNRELSAENVFDIQDEIATAIVKALKSKLGINADTFTTEIANINIDAYNEYLQGRYFVEKRTQEDIDIALIHFSAAIELAPGYALAWMGKAWANYWSSERYYGNIPHEIALERAVPAIDKAMLLGPDLPQVNARMGWILLAANSEYKKIIPYFEKAIQLNPSYSDVYKSLALYKTDSPVEVLQILKKARQLNPLSMSDNNSYAKHLIRFGKLNEAEKIAKHMLTINASQYAPYNVLSDIRIVQRRQAQAALLSAKAVELTSGLIYSKYIAASLHADIGLHEQAAELMSRTPFDMIQHRFSGNIGLYISQTREKFPRNDKDSFGMVARATAELYAGNYKESAKYYELSKMCSTCSQKIHVYFQVGNKEAAQQILDRVKDRLTRSINAGMLYYRSLTYIVPIDVKSMEVASLEGDVDRAIMHLKRAMMKKYIISFEYKYNPIYAKLRAHKDWPSILAESNKLAAEQHEIYQKLVLEGTNLSL